MFKWQRKNTIAIEMTSLRIRAVPALNGGFLSPPVVANRKKLFEIPYASISSVQVYPHPAHLGLMDVLDLQYVEGRTVHEKSICTYKGRVQEAWRVIWTMRPDLAGTR